MRESLGSNLSLEAKVGLICPTPTAPTNPLLAAPASPPTSLLDLLVLQGACRAASHLAHCYASFKKCVQHNGIPPGWVISLLRAFTTLTVTVHFT